MSNLPASDSDNVPVGPASRSASISRLAPAFVQVQIQLRPVAKNAINPHFESKFADLASILEEALPILNEHGLALAQFPSTDDNGRPLLRSYLLHESGQFISDEMPLMVDKANPQGQGSALTYARRYAACAILGIRTADDDGNQGSGREPRQARRSERAPQQNSQQQPDAAAPPQQQRPEPPEPIVPPGFANFADSKRAHDAVMAQLRALKEVVAIDNPIRQTLQEFVKANGFPMAKETLIEYSMMIAKAMPATAPQTAENPSEAAVPPPDPVAAQDGPQKLAEGSPVPTAPCPWCSKAITAEEIAAGIILSLPNDDPAEPAYVLHDDCYETWKADQAPPEEETEFDRAIAQPAAR
jgi:hypothetical protein